MFEFECARTRTQNNMCPCYVVRLFCCKVAKEVDTIAIDIDICHSICRSWTRCTQVGSGGIDVKEQIFTTTTVTVAAIRLCCALFMFDSSFVVYILTKSSFFVCVCVWVSIQHSGIYLYYRIWLLVISNIDRLLIKSRCRLFINSLSSYVIAAVAMQIAVDCWLANWQSKRGASTGQLE